MAPDSTYLRDLGLSGLVVVPRLPSNRRQHCHLLLHHLKHHTEGSCQTATGTNVNSHAKMYLLLAVSTENNNVAFLPNMVELFC